MNMSADAIAYAMEHHKSQVTLNYKQSTQRTYVFKDRHDNAHCRGILFNQMVLIARNMADTSRIYSSTTLKHCTEELIKLICT